MSETDEVRCPSVEGNGIRCPCGAPMHDGIVARLTGENLALKENLVRAVDLSQSFAQALHTASELHALMVEQRNRLERDNFILLMILVGVSFLVLLASVFGWL